MMSHRSLVSDFFLERRGDPRSVRSTWADRLRERLSVPVGRLAMQPALLLQESRFFNPSDSLKLKKQEDPLPGTQLRANAHRFGLLPR